MKQKEIRVAKTSALIIGTFILCWTPITVLDMIIAYTRDLTIFDGNAVSRNCFMFSVCAAHFNSAIDPIIYAYRIKDVRVTIRNILRCGRQQ